MTFTTVVVDPPWQMPLSGPYGWRDGKSSRTRSLDYPMMDLAEIAAIGVPEVLAPEGQVFLWTVQRHLESALGLVRDAWGLTYSCTLVWAKEPRGWGPGGYFQSTVEFCVYAWRGRPRHTGRRGVVGQCFSWPRVGGPDSCHSVKPPQFYDLVMAECEGPYLDVFARSGRMGWATAGLQSLGEAVVPGVRNAA